MGEHRIRRFLRIQVQVNNTKSLKTTIFIKNDDGFIRWLAFKYERLSDFYFRCGKLGHVMVHCDEFPAPTHDMEDPRTSFGAWLRAAGSWSTEQTWIPQIEPDEGKQQSAGGEDDGDSGCITFDHNRPFVCSQPPNTFNPRPTLPALYDITNVRPLCVH